jgi:hypothetical protein
MGILTHSGMHCVLPQMRKLVVAKSRCARGKFSEKNLSRKKIVLPNNTLH